jgi:hypothetical protein
LGAAVRVWNREGDQEIGPRARSAKEHPALAYRIPWRAGARDRPLQPASADDLTLVVSFELIGARRQHEELGDTPEISAPRPEFQIQRMLAIQFGPERDVGCDT